MVNIPNPFVNIPVPGDHLTYGTLEITFKIDEDLMNYLEIHNWIKSLGKPENYTQYQNIQNQNPLTGEGIYSDISLTVLNSASNPNYEIVYINAFPISLSGATFNSTDSDVNYMEASATFKYVYYDIIKKT